MKAPDNKDKLLANILTEMANDFSVDLEFACECADLAETDSRMLFLMKTWVNSNRKNRDKLVLEMENYLSDKYLYGE